MSDNRSGWSRRAFVQATGGAAGAAMFQPAFAAPGDGGAGGDDVIAFKSGLELAALLRNKALSSVEMTQYFIDRIERYDTRLNAIPVRIFEQALTHAARADAALARGEILGPLHGLPMTIKESFDIAGTANTWGNPAWKDNISSSDAEMVTRYKGSGAHFLGKTNVPFMLNDYQAFNDIYGTTNNPWDVTRTPGGSSGGTAAALAAGLTGLDSGSDIGGSIRNPAHYCGVYGHKPTWGVVPSDGHSPPGGVGEADLAVVGPMARSAEDLAAAMNIVAGANRLNAPGWRLALPPPRMKSLGELRVALLTDHPACAVEPEIADRVTMVGDVVKKLGARISDTARPEFVGTEGNGVYLKLLLAIVGGDTGNVDHRQWMGLDAQRTRYRMAWQAFFADWDVLVCPIMPTTAFPHDESKGERTLVVNGTPMPYYNQVFWAGIATLSYLPATVFPTGLSKGGLPIGLQVIGAGYDDATTIEFARLMALEIGGYQPPPGYAA